MSHANTTEEGTRNVVGECMGKLALADAAVLLPRVCDALATSAGQPAVRATLVTAVKFVMCETTSSVKNHQEGGGVVVGW